jgi:hypothetical protein
LKGTDFKIAREFVGQIEYLKYIRGGYALYHDSGVEYLDYAPDPKKPLELINIPITP